MDILTLGATIAGVRTPDKNGVWKDIALGFDSPVEYLKRGGCHGATIGRYARRIGNGRFTLNGKTWELEKTGGAYDPRRAGEASVHCICWTFGVEGKEPS